MVYIYYISYSKFYLFVNIFYIANDETTAANQRENIVIQSMTFCGSSSASNSSG